MAVGRTNGAGRKNNLLLDASSLKTVTTPRTSGQIMPAVFTNMDLSHQYWLFNYIAFVPNSDNVVTTSGILDIKASKIRTIMFAYSDGQVRALTVNNDFNVTIDDVAMTVTISGQSRGSAYYSLAKIEGLS